MTTEKSSEILSSNPIHLKEMIGKTLTIETINNLKHSGVLYVIDPIYKTVVLYKEDSPNLKIIFYHAIKSINIDSDEVANTSFTIFPPLTITESEEDSMKKKKLIKWLKHMYIDAEECDSGIQVGEHLLIISPYTKDDCISDNTIILEKIRNMLDLMPDTFS